MNFLHKRYTSSNVSNSYQTSGTQSQIKTFLPSTSANNSPPQIGLNNCDHHPNELIRHMCIQCIEMLCSECISDHLELHRQAKTFPKIQSLKQVKIEMTQKLQNITHFMSERSPEKLDIEIIKKFSIDKIDEMKRELIRAIDQWVIILKNHLIDGIGFEEIHSIRTEMQKLFQEVSILKNTLHLNAAPSIIKRIYQIDGDKLENGYQSMFDRYNALRRRSQFQFDVNWKQIIKSLEQNIKVNQTSNGNQLYIEEAHSQIDSIKQEMEGINKNYFKKENGFDQKPSLSERSSNKEEKSNIGELNQ